MKSSINKYSHISREILIETDQLGLITFITPNCSNLLRHNQIELLSTNINKYLNFDFNTITFNEPFQAKFNKESGLELYFNILVSPKGTSTNQPVGFILSLIHISKCEYLKEIDSKFINLFEQSKDIIFKLQVIPDIKFTYLSPSIENILGYSVDDFLCNPTLSPEIIHPEDYAIQLSKTNKNTDFSNLFNVRFKHKDGHYVWLEDYMLPTFNCNGELISIEGVSRDITKRKELEETLKKLSYVDGLTEVYNRTYLNKQIEILTCHVDIPIAIIACDLDNLKYLNDTYGHFKGDILLKNVGKFLNNFFLDSIVIRNGGDEFIIILTDLSKEKAKETYSKMLLSIRKYNESHKMPITLSSGFSYAYSSKSILELLSKADKNMYKNKYDRKNRVLLIN